MKSVRVGGMLFLFILITSGSAFANSCCLVWEFPCRIVVLEERYCSPCRDRIACIREDTLITELKAALVACEIARREICPVCCRRHCCCPSTICRPVKTRCLSVVKKKVKVDPCFEERVKERLDRIDCEIEALKSRVRSLEIEAFKKDVTEH